MTFIPVPNAAELVFKFLWRNHVTVMALAFDLNTIPDTEDCEGLIDYGNTFWNSYLQALMAQDIQRIEMSATSLTSSDGAYAVLPVSPAQAGGSSPESVGNNSSPVLSLRTNNRGRSFRGRIFVPGTPTGALDTPNSIASVYQADLLEAFQTLIDTPPETPPGVWGVVSKFANGAPRETGVISPIAFVTCDLKMGTQRRRMKDAN
jgi:hypothetical protein